MGATTTVLRIELWHGLLLAVLLGILGPMKIIEPWALLLGGLFMGVNFFLLSYGVWWILVPLAGKGKVKAGVFLLVLKFVGFLGLMTLLFFRVRFDGVSFSLGFSSLVLAIVVEALVVSKRRSEQNGTSIYMV